MQVAKSKYWYSLKRLIPAKAFDPLLVSYYNTRSLLYRGTAVSCNFCKQSFDHFIGGTNCPRCGSAKRHRLMLLFLQRRTNLFNDDLKVLHFAPELCFLNVFSRLKNIDYYSADINSPRARIKVDMTNIQFPDNYFDVVISSHVLEHIPDDHKAMKELWRVMKPDGWGIHQVPIRYSLARTFEDDKIKTDEMRLRYYGHIDHKRIYGKDYKNRLVDAAFKVDEIDFSRELTTDEIDKYQIDRAERIYFCRK